MDMKAKIKQFIGALEVLDRWIGNDAQDSRVQGKAGCWAQKIFATFGKRGKHDPREDPRKGDVLRQKNGHHRLHVDMVRDRWVYYRVTNDMGGLLGAYYMALTQWQRETSERCEEETWKVRIEKWFGHFHKRYRLNSKEVK